MTAAPSPHRLDLDTAVRSVLALPVLPEVALHLIRSLDNPDLDLDTLERRIELDQALTAKVLRIANSSFYGLSRQVETVRDASMVLGFGTLRTLAIATVTINHFATLRLPQDFKHRVFWSHSLAVGLCAELLAKRLGQFEGVSFMAGLMHDIGRLVLAACFPSHLQACTAHQKTEHCDKLTAELAVLGITHAQIGAALATHWHFPVIVVEAIALHHHPDAATTPVPHLVHLADALVNGKLRPGPPAEWNPHVSTLSWSRHGLDNAAFEDTLLTLHARMAATDDILP